MARVKYYNKLVRDHIPDIIQKGGKSCQTRTLSDEEYVRELVKKLQEEVDEFAEQPDVEELADILEVVKALSETLNTDIDQVESVRKNKAQDRGAFENKIYLEWVE